MRHIDLWRRLGVRSGIEIKRREPDPWGHVVVADNHSWHERGRHGFDPALQIVGLEHALKHPTRERSLLLWNLISSLSVPIRGEVEKSTRQNYSGSSIEKVDSPVAKLLAEHQWLLDAQGNWRRPEEVTLEDLDSAYPRDEALALRLAMRPTAAREIAEFLEIESEELDMLRRRPDLLRRFLAQIREQEQEAGLGDSEDKRRDAEAFSDTERLHLAAAIFDAFNQEGEEDLEDFTGDGSAGDPARRRKRAVAALGQSQEAEPTAAERFTFLSRKVWEPPRGPRLPARDLRRPMPDMPIDFPASRRTALLRG